MTFPRRAWGLCSACLLALLLAGPARAAADDPRLPRVLVIGDSIAIGYTPYVETRLAGVAHVERIPENGQSTAQALARLQHWLGDGRWDVIHFNWGLHDLKLQPDGSRQVPLPAYEANLRELTRRLRATGARLVFATSTPVPAAIDRLKVRRVASDVLAYNAAARRVMADFGVPVTDLHAVATPRLADLQVPDDPHFTEPGYEALAAAVADGIAAHLANRFVEAGGVLSMEAEHGTRQQGWRQGASYTGIGMFAPSNPAGEGFLEFDVRVDGRGPYSLHVLGHRRRNTPVADNVLAVQVAAAGQPPSTVERVVFRELNAPAWTSRRRDGEGRAQVSFPAPGEYRLRLVAEAGAAFYVDKIVLSAGTYVPTGTGPAETRHPDVAPAGPGLDPLVVLPPAWAFGVLYGGYTDQQESLAVVDRLLAAGFPVDAYWVDSWFWDSRNQGRGPAGYLSFVEDKAAFPDVERFWSQLQQRGVKAGIWVWNAILREGNEATFEEFAKAGAFSRVYVERDPWHNHTRRSEIGNVDFDNPVAVALWRRKLAPFFARGLDFLKIDRSSDIAFSRAAFEATQDFGRETAGRGFILAHLHSTHDPRHKLYPAKWTGDAKIAWSQPDYPDTGVYAMGGFRENVAMVADPARSTYAVPFLSHDAGGYDFFGSEDFGPELYARWMQFASLNSLMHVFSHSRNASRNHPTWFAEPVQAAVRKYTTLRMRLFPYLYTGALETRLSGRKLVRGDGVHAGQYLLGDHLLVAPVTEKGAARWTVHLPAGRAWIDWDTGARHEGGQAITLDTPLDKLPLLVGEGAIVPLRDYAPSIEAGTNDRLTLEIHPAGQETAFVLREDDGRSNDYLHGAIASTEVRVRRTPEGVHLRVLPVAGEFAGMKAERAWVARVHGIEHPRAATVDGRAVAVDYDLETRTAVVTFTAPRRQAVELWVR